MKKEKTDKSGILFVICGPSGVGKTTLMNAIIKSSLVSLSPVITYTTRAPRSLEVDGVDYFFISKERFNELKSASFFLEVTEIAGNSYGTPISLIESLARGNHYIAVLDRSGISSFKLHHDNVCAFWIHTASFCDLENRLSVRGDFDLEILRKRMDLAILDAAAEKMNPVCQFSICNDNLVDASTLMINIIKKVIDKKAFIGAIVDNIYP